MGWQMLVACVWRTTRRRSHHHRV